MRDVRCYIKAAAIAVANRMRIGLVTITVDDMLLTCDYRCAMEVKACVQVDGDCNLMVHCFEFVRTEGFAKVCRRSASEFGLRRIHAHVAIALLVLTL